MNNHDLYKEIVMHKTSYNRSQIKDGKCTESDVEGIYDDGIYVIKSFNDEIKIIINENGIYNFDSTNNQSYHLNQISLICLEKSVLLRTVSISKENFKQVFHADFYADSHEMVLSKLLDYFCNDILSMCHFIDFHNVVDTRVDDKLIK